MQVHYLNSAEFVLFSAYLHFSQCQDLLTSTYCYHLSSSNINGTKFSPFHSLLRFYFLVVNDMLVCILLDLDHEIDLFQMSVID
jgi:hypothetical protein